MNTRIIAVWVCPNSDCNNYYGSESMSDLRTSWNHDIKNRPTFTREKCPNCGTMVSRELRFAVLLDFGPDAIGQQVPDENALVQAAYRSLREVGHESVS